MYQIARLPTVELVPDMIDQLLKQVQQRLDQLAGEVGRLREALASLDPRFIDAAGCRAFRSRTPTRPVCDAHEEGAGDEGRRRQRERAGQPRFPPPDGRRVAHEGLVLRCAGRRRGTSRKDRSPRRQASPGGTISTTPSKLAQTGEAQKAEHGYRIAHRRRGRAPPPSSAPAAAGE